MNNTELNLNGKTDLQLSQIGLLNCIDNIASEETYLNHQLIPAQHNYAMLKKHSDWV